MTQQDPFTGETGLADDFDGVVVEPWFATDASAYDPRTLFMFWRIKLDNPADFPNLEGGEVTERWSAGAEWESIDNGKTAQSTSGKQRFNVNSNYFKLIAKCVNDLNIRPVLEAKGTPMEAAMWEGLHFHFQREPYDYTLKDRETGQQRRVQGYRLYPTAYLGAEGSAAKAPAEPLDLSSLGLSDATVAELQRVAEASANHGAFVSGVLGLPEEHKSDSLINSLSDERLFRTLKG